MRQPFEPMWCLADELRSFCDFSRRQQRSYDRFKRAQINLQLASPCTHVLINNLKLFQGAHHNF